jgi:hypothetical protein
MIADQKRMTLLVKSIETPSIWRKLRPSKPSTLRAVNKFGLAENDLRRRVKSEFAHRSDQEGTGIKGPNEVREPKQSQPGDCFVAFGSSQ